MEAIFDSGNYRDAEGSALPALSPAENLFVNSNLT